MIAIQTPEDGQTSPLYDFVFLDGAHNWTIDGLAVYLLERLLRVGGWLLLDDLEWSYSSYFTDRASVLPGSFELSTDEWTRPHVRSIFELIVRPHPAFGEFIENEGTWAWARKSPRTTGDVHLEPSWPLALRIKTASLALAERVRQLTSSSAQGLPS